MKFDEFALEEYKIAKERVRKCEAIRYQMVTLNFTIFGVIFGLQSSIDNAQIPLALLITTIFCLSRYKGQSRRQIMTITFISEKYEKQHEIIEYETLLQEISGQGRKSSKFRNSLRKLLPTSYSIFFVFGIISFSLFLITGIEYLSTTFSKNDYLTFAIYLIVNLIGYFILLRMLYNKGATLEEMKSIYQQKIKK